MTLIILAIYNFKFTLVLVWQGGSWSVGLEYMYLSTPPVHNFGKDLTRLDQT